MTTATPTPVQVQRVTPGDASTTDLQADLARARLLANWLDARFSIGGIRFGFDAIIGLIPGVGDTITSIIGLYPIWVAQRHQLGKTLQLRMAANVMLDLLPGVIPVVGDMIDVAFKSNLKNLKLLERAAEKRLRKG